MKFQVRKNLLPNEKSFLSDKNKSAIKSYSKTKVENSKYIRGKRS